jgi:hypothetical protein
MKWLALLGATVALCLSLWALWECWQRATWKRRLAKMKDEADFARWLDRVNDNLRQFGRDTSDRREDDWFIDFQIGLTPEQAAKKLVQAGRT